MELSAYFERIGFAGPAQPDLATLVALHRAHLLAIPYENLDVQLGRPLTTDPAAAYDKIVRRGRGGWCYEMNGLFGWALDHVGFKVTRLAGGVMRHVRGDFTVGGHLVLLVELPEGPWIADVGFGDGALEPFPLAAASFRQAGYEFRLESVEDGWWRFHNQPFGGAPAFDFSLRPADPALLAQKCAWLQSAPESSFVLNLVCQRWRGSEILQLLGRSYRQVSPTGRREHLLESPDELVAVLRADFGLNVPEVASLWPRIVARHEQVMADLARTAAQPA